MPVFGISANLSPSQRTKLILHERCNHVNFETINKWIRKGVLPVDKSVANSKDSICAACQFGKANKRAHKADVGSITAKHTAPGQGVSVDLLESGIPGRIPTTRGLPSPKQYRYVTLWVDHYSRYLYPTFHETKDLNAALASKREFEVFANKFGVKIASIRADNGVYAANGFQSDCDEKGQSLTFCAVGGHWQNGVVERAIGVITRTARTILLHAMSRWPSMVTEEFWPFAVRHACTFHNASVRSDTGLSPHHMFTGELAPWKLEDFRVFGSPVYVLAKRLQDGDTLPKWKARSWLGIYVGPSLVHAGNVPVIYNPLTTHISPQFHVVYDDQFTSVTSPPDTFNNTFYQKLYEKANWFYTNTSATNSTDVYTFDTYWIDPPISTKRVKQLYKDKVTRGENNIKTNVATTNETSEIENTFKDISHNKRDKAATHDPTHNESLPYQIKYNLVPVHSCSAHLTEWKHNNGVHAEVFKLKDPSLLLDDSLAPTPDFSHIPVSLLSYAHIAQTQLSTPASTSVATNKEDILTQSQMLKTSDREEFIASQTTEISGLHKFDVMDIHHISKLPPRARLLSSIWSYRRKRLPNGVLLKYKSRLCVNGKEQSFGRDYWETYAPVASWATIRLMLVMATLLNLKTRQVDYTQAFPQAILDDPVFMRVPQGWFVDQGKLKQHPNPKHNDTAHYMQLKRNLYGCK